MHNYGVAILCIVIILILLIVQYNNIKSLNEGFTSFKCAIVVLTKGYDNNEKYNQLIERNVSIYDKLYKYNPNLYDVIVYHEGNITLEQQQYIQRKTSNMPIIFKHVQFYKKDITNSFCPPTPLSSRFSMGYKNMCYFWSIDFLNYLKDYKYIIRIDEDCVLKKIDENIVSHYDKNNIMYGSPYFQGTDEPGVVVGMEQMFNSFMIKHNINKKREVVQSPYTNFFIMNMDYFNHNKYIKMILDEIAESNCIWSNRWGDLPVWGYILSYMVDTDLYKEDKSIQYIHGSHNNAVIN